MPKKSVDFIICFAYSEPDLQPYSSYCLSISAIANAVRYFTKSDSFYGVFFLLSLTNSEMTGVTECSDILYEKLKQFKRFQDNASDPFNPFE